MSRLSSVFHILFTPTDTSEEEKNCFIYSSVTIECRDIFTDETGFLRHISCLQK